MKITDVKIRKSDKNNAIKGTATIVIDECFVVNEIKIIESKNGLFIAMPSKKNLNGEFKDIVHPITTEARDKIQRAILEKYEKTENIEE